MSKKRKAIKTDTAEISGSDSDVEFEPGLLDGNLSSGDEDLVSLVGDEEDYPSGSEDASEFESLNEEASASEDDNAGKIVGKNGVQSLKSRKEKPKGGLVRVNGAAQQSTLHIGSGLDLSEDMNGTSRSDEEPGLEYTITEDANGNPRYVYGPIDPVYDSDDSDALATTNTIGNIPLSFYDSYPHIGYDINGKKVMRPAKGEALDALLDSVELPKGWTGLTDPATGKPLELTQEELEVLRRIHGNEIPEEGFDPYPATVEYFTSKTEIMPLSAAPEPKRRFVPSKHEAKRIMKIVRAIREGRIMPYRPPPEEEEEDETAPTRYDIWANEAPRPDHVMNIPAPKLPIPGFDQSYNPPREYLPSKSEKKAWEEADQEDREKEYLPTRYDALRKVPGYDQFTKERFDRCLDLYLAPRVRRSRLNIDPESLLPKLPSPDELRPFPTTCSAIFRGHNSRVRSLAIDPSGIWLASGGDDGTVRLWELLTGRQVWNVTLSSEEAVNVVRWRPTMDAFILTAAVGNDIYFIIPPLVDPTFEAASIEILRAGFGYAASNTSSTAGTQKKDAPGKWTRATLSLVSSSVHVCISVRAPVKVLSWHRRGDYLVSCSPTGQSASIGMHTLSKHLSQLPFRRLKGLAQSVQFHPSKPILFVATQRAIRSYDLQKQELIKVLQPGARWISSFDMHPGGDNLIVGSYDRRLLWHDLDLSSKPYKTLRYHSKAIRAVRFHPGGHPLFADASDDGSVQVFHGKVVSDAMENATIVPLKVLRGHKVTKELGVLDIAFHPREPWLVSAGADGTCRLWM